MRWLVSFVALLGAIGITCSKSDITVVRSFPLDKLDEVIAGSNVAIDKEITSDGKGSLRVEASNAITVPLFEVRDLNIDNARIFYQARIRTENVIGQVFLEMLVHLPGRGESFSRSQQTLVSGTTDWTTQETPFFLKSGERPDYIKLNLVINGQGTAWIDDIKLVKGPLG
ncbi:MAG: hypothetical protein A2W25_00430 [candidate division Zixibacteria bacterium RBG_16_53_22]|nr:MAG: hypothetical protein A2W25_00430 [candidate division Zixibacteria bacterium RBG_16_53_22]